MRKQFPTLADAFMNYFDVDLVNGDDMTAKAAGVRYRVYCEEFDFERSDDFPDHLETDSFDSYSIQSLITHRRTGQSAGCVRLVCASHEQQLPLELHCLNSVYLETAELLMSERAKVCEFSRLAVDSRFRKRAGEDHTRLGEFDALDCSHQELRTFSMVGMAAFLSAFALAQIANRTKIFAMMEPKLPALLRRAGIVVQQSGDFVDYHGKRAVYYVALDGALLNMREDVRVLYDEIHRRLDASYRRIAAVA